MKLTDYCAHTTFPRLDFSYFLSIDARQSEDNLNFKISFKQLDILPSKRVIASKVMTSFCTKWLITRKFQISRYGVIDFLTILSSFDISLRINFLFFYCFSKRNFTIYFLSFFLIWTGILWFSVLFYYLRVTTNNLVWQKYCKYNSRSIKNYSFLLLIKTHAK